MMGLTPQYVRDPGQEVRADFAAINSRNTTQICARERRILRGGSGCASMNRLTSASFSRDPLADVCRAILELDAVLFAVFEKPDSISIHEG